MIPEHGMNWQPRCVLKILRGQVSLARKKYTNYFVIVHWHLWNVLREEWEKSVEDDSREGLPEKGNRDGK